MKEMFMVSMPAVLIILLMIASAFDIKNQIIPVWISGIGFAIKGMEMALCEPNALPRHLMFAILLFAVLFTNVLLGGLGGADSLIGAMCGIYMGIYGVIAVMLAFLLSMPYAAYLKFHEKENCEYPFIPYVLIGTCMVFAFSLSKGITHF